jgi:hypothetical protein
MDKTQSQKNQLKYKSKIQRAATTPLIFGFEKFSGYRMASPSLILYNTAFKPTLVPS